MINYWLVWSLLTMFKWILLSISVIGAVGGILHPKEFLLLVILFIPLSIWLLYDFIYQVLVPFYGGKGYRLHKPIDTPVWIGLAPPYREAKEIAKRGHSIIWE